MMTEDEVPDVRLRRDIDRICEVIRLQQVIIDRPPALQSLAVYQAADPPRVLIDGSRVATPLDRTLVLAHEVFHALLHPNVVEPDGGVETREEERVVHACADKLCRNYGVLGYREFMERSGAIIEPPSYAESRMIDPLVAMLEHTLADPNSARSWREEDPAGAIRGLILRFR